MIRTLVTVLIMLVGSSQAFAHSKLAWSNPANGQLLAQSPSELQLNFNSAVTLMAVVVERSAVGRAVNTGFSAASELVEHYQLPLPHLVPDNYQVRWMALGADGHKVKGSFGFVVVESAASTGIVVPSMINAGSRLDS